MPTFQYELAVSARSPLHWELLFSGGGDMLAGDGASQEATYTKV